VLFADEPTGALDSLAGEQVIELLTATAREQSTPLSWSPTNRGSPHTPTRGHRARRPGHGPRVVAP
jgi:predicted ABC-type transport system involved in lysophospholipase L1 biosynthesis ATPase subunit